jgi:hypothetical protein
MENEVQKMCSNCWRHHIEHQSNDPCNCVCHMPVPQVPAGDYSQMHQCPCGLMHTYDPATGKGQIYAKKKPISPDEKEPVGAA